jgi:hypothetical protein
LDPFLLLVIVFIVAPLIERLLKAGRQDQSQLPPRRPQRPPPMQRPREEPQPRVVIRREDDEDAAVAMLPDDLWEILTGEKRTPALPPEPVAEAEEYETYDEHFGTEAETLEQTSAGEWISLPPEPEPAPPTRAQPTVPAPRPSGWQDYKQERDRVAARRSAGAPIRAEQGYVRPVPRYDAPKVVSLEDLEIDDELRHDRFHEKLENLPPAARGRTRTPNAYRFTTDDDLRRAIIMMEVLGRPRGLD